MHTLRIVEEPVSERGPIRGRGHQDRIKTAHAHLRHGSGCAFAVSPHTRSPGLVNALSVEVAGALRDGLPLQAGRATAGNGARANHRHTSRSACAPARKLVQVLREERADRSRTCPIQAPPAVGRSAGRMARNPARRRGTRKRKRPTGEGWALNGGGQGRNRTTDTRIFSPLLYRLSYLAAEDRHYSGGKEKVNHPWRGGARPAGRGFVPAGGSARGRACPGRGGWVRG